jgi:hypothetical protein
MQGVVVIIGIISLNGMDDHNANNRHPLQGVNMMIAPGVQRFIYFQKRFDFVHNSYGAPSLQLLHGLFLRKYGTLFILKICN